LQEEYRVLTLDDSVAGVRAMVCGASRGVSNDQLHRYPDLEILAVYGVGLDKVDLDYAAKRGLIVANTPGVLDDAVAEHALALTLAASRRICQADEYVRQGEWSHTVFPLSRGLSGKRCGILGLGRIGRGIARRAEAFGMEIAYHGRHHQPDAPCEYFDSLWSLATWSDILILSLTGGPETEGIVGEEILRALGPQGLLVNIARGSVVDEEALLEALEYGDLGGAALDVFRNEPHVPEGLLELPNVVLTPHLGSATQETRHAMAQSLLENLRAHFLGAPVPGRVELPTP
jgi:lactate dehydrogenase-like 2-hydroxyacid dehydrogenase